MARLNRYCKIWNNFVKPIDVLNCDIGGDKVQNVLWQVQNLPIFFFLKKYCHFLWYQQFTLEFSRGYS